jgi:hypothetical protein
MCGHVKSLETETSEHSHECWKEVTDFILAQNYIFWGIVFNHTNNKTGKIWVCTRKWKPLAEKNVSFQWCQISDKNQRLNTNQGTRHILNSHLDWWGHVSSEQQPRYLHHDHTRLWPDFYGWAREQGKHDFIPSATWHLPSFCFILQCESAQVLAFFPTFLPTWASCFLRPRTLHGLS